MGKRKRPGVCEVCQHYHEFEACGVCGHIMPDHSDKTENMSIFPSEIVPQFLFLGSYDYVCHFQTVQLLKTEGISHVLDICKKSALVQTWKWDTERIYESSYEAVPFCRNCYKNAFTFHSLQLQDDKKLPFDDAVQFLEQCKKDKGRVLVCCMTGKNRSPAIVMAYLMKSKGWTLEESYRLVTSWRPFVQISEEVFQQLLDYEEEIFGASSPTNNSMPSFSPFFSSGF